MKQLHKPGLFKAYYIICIISLLLSACKEMETLIPTGGTLIGKWKLTEVLADPGDGSGKWTTPDKDSYITFNTDNTIDGFAPNIKGYEIIDSVNLKLIRADNTKLNYRYKLTSTSLTINPPCIEACGLKYAKVNSSSL